MKILLGREHRIHKEPPSPDRWKNRSRTYQGIAVAMANQWGNPQNQFTKSILNIIEL